MAVYKPREKVFWFSVTSRVTIILLQFVFNSICPDHNADAFRAPRSDLEQISISDKSVDTLLGGLTRWDSQYFIHIAKYGYTYENTLAFFPLYPISVRCVAIVLGKILFTLNEHSVFTVSAIFINFVCFILSAVIFYDLSERVLGCKNTAYKAAILYCVNPASIFFSAAYSESMFSCLTFYAMLASLENDRLVSLPIGLSALVRSNGLVNIGFPIFSWLQDWFFIKFPAIARNYRNPRGKNSIYFVLNCTDFWSISILCTICLCLVPFLLFQIYIHVLFCTDYSRSISIPDHVVSFASANYLPMPGNDNLSWCRESSLNVYSIIQQKYWNVGFMKYYRIKQIPNFILAAPIFFIMVKCVSRYFIEHKRVLVDFAIGRSKRGLKEAQVVQLPTQAFVFVVHGLFLTLFSMLFVHIQVSTRLLASASPLPYWYCAKIMSYRNNNIDKSNAQYEQENNIISRWKVFFMVQKHYTTTDTLVLMYFLGYSILGSFMYSNFLPWT